MTNRIIIGTGPTARSYQTYTTANRAIAAHRRVYGAGYDYQAHPTKDGRWYVTQELNAEEREKNNNQINRQDPDGLTTYERILKDLAAGGINTAETS